MRLTLRLMAVAAGLSVLPRLPAAGTGWRYLFDDRTLEGWSVIDFIGHGGASVTAEGFLEVEMGRFLSGVVYTGEVPTVNYEVSLHARRVEGADFFCGLTVPVGDSHCTLIVGGWGGGVFGISSIDGLDASENETSTMLRFETGRWYEIRFRVTEDRLMAWLDGKQIILADVTGRRVSLRPGEISMGRPFSLTTYATTAQFKDVKLRRVAADGSLRKWGL